MPRNSGKYNNERRISISRTLLCEVQEEVLTGILTFLVGERGGGAPEREARAWTEPLTRKY